jgi:hypothetical protein
MSILKNFGTREEFEAALQTDKRISNINFNTLEYEVEDEPGSIKVERYGWCLNVGMLREYLAYMPAKLRVDTCGSEILFYDDSFPLDDPDFDFNTPEYESHTIQTFVWEDDPDGFHEECGHPIFIRSKLPE